MTDETKMPRLTMRDIFQSVAGVFNLDHGLLRTLLDLAVRPGQFFHRYFHVQRSTYTPPLTLLLLMLAGIVLCSRHLLPVDHTYSPNFILTIAATNDHELAILQLLREYDDVVRLLLVPITSAMSFALFRKQQWFFAEHLVFNAYIQAFHFFLMILFVPASLGNMEWVAGLACLLFFYYAYLQCMDGNRFLIIAKATVVIIISNLLFACLIYPFELVVASRTA